MISTLSPFAIFAVIFASGIVTSCAILLIGGVGVERVQNRRLSELENDYQTLSDRLTSEIRRRSANSATEKRQTAKEVEEEASRRLAQTQPVHQYDFQ